MRVPVKLEEGPKLLQFYSDMIGILRAQGDKPEEIAVYPDEYEALKFAILDTKSGPLFGDFPLPVHIKGVPFRIQSFEPEPFEISFDMSVTFVADHATDENTVLHTWVRDYLGTEDFIVTKKKREHDLFENVYVYTLVGVKWPVGAPPCHPNCNSLPLSP